MQKLKRNVDFKQEQQELEKEFLKKKAAARRITIDPKVNDISENTIGSRMKQRRNITLSLTLQAD